MKNLKEEINEFCETNGIQKSSYCREIGIEPSAFYRRNSSFNVEHLVLLHSLFSDKDAYKEVVELRLKNIFKSSQRDYDFDALTTESCAKIFTMMLKDGVFNKCLKKKSK